MKLFRGSSSGTQRETEQPAQKLTRRSSSLGELSRLWASDSPLCVLDVGSTSPSNIRFFTERGHKIYSEDLLVASTEPIWSRRMSRTPLSSTVGASSPTICSILRRISTSSFAGIFLTIWTRASYVRSWEGYGPS